MCSGLAIARDDLGKPLAEDKYLLLNVLNAKGISGLLGFASREYRFEPRQAGYINKCDLCTEIRFFLVKEGYDLSKELCPGEFYS